MPTMEIRWPTEAGVDARRRVQAALQEVTATDGARAEVSLLEVPGDAPQPLPGFPFRVRPHPPRRSWVIRVTAPTEAALEAIQARLRGVTAPLPGVDAT